jgi:hypothetical protein
MATYPLNYNFNNQPTETNDNKVAIDMLNNVSSILRGIEFNDVKQIDAGLKYLKNSIISFEKVFYDNLINNRYK